jgi:thiamine-monophosphate kinase
MKKTEAALIAKMRGIGPTVGGPATSIPLGIGDDAALLAAKPGYQTILTCDWFLEGSHFLRDKHPADSVGWKCLARAISDVAAMGGEPRCFLLSLALPPTCTGRWLDGFLGGLRRAARKFKCPLVGGDTTRRAEILINVAVVGEVKAGRALLRSGARPGDVVFVSGSLGEAEAGLRLLRGRKFRQSTQMSERGIKDRTLRKHLYPEPRIALGRCLSDGRIATAMMDLSDGLSSDLPRLCAASGVGARIVAEKLPAVEVTARRGAKRLDPLDLALNGGDDYELLFTVSPSKARRLPRAFQGITLTAIGEITCQPKLSLIRADRREQPLRPDGWDPFR